MADSSHRFYEEDEAEQILKLAATLSSSTGAMSRERLLQTAAELGITPEAVELAETQFATQKQLARERKQFDLEQRREFNSFVLTFFVITGALLALNIFTGAHFLWAFWLSGLMLIGIAFEAVETFVRGRQAYQEAFAKWKSKRDRTAARAELIARPSVDASAIIDKYVHKRLDKGKEVSRWDAIRYLQEKTELDSIDAKEAVERYVVQNPGLMD